MSVVLPLPAIPITRITTGFFFLAPPGPGPGEGRPLVSPPVLRSKSLQGVPSSLQDAPGSLSESEPARGGGSRVKLVYDQVLNCYFDPVSHRYFELR